MTDEWQKLREFNLETDAARRRARTPPAKSLGTPEQALLVARQVVKVASLPFVLLIALVTGVAYINGRGGKD